jgi:hypothetical protein
MRATFGVTDISFAMIGYCRNGGDIGTKGESYTDMH